MQTRSQLGLSIRASVYKCFLVSTPLHGLAPLPQRLRGSGCALQSAAAARDHNFLQWPGLCLKRGATHSTHVRVCFLSSAAQKEGMGVGWGWVGWGLGTFGKSKKGGD